MDFFSLLQQDPKATVAFNKVMTSLKDPLGDLYDFSSLQAEEDGVILVDIGGGKGQSIQGIRSSYPTLKGVSLTGGLLIVFSGCTNCWARE